MKMHVKQGIVEKKLCNSYKTNGEKKAQKKKQEFLSDILTKKSRWITVILCGKYRIYIKVALIFIHIC